jgi:hypothetical protein
LRPATPSSRFQRAALAGQLSLFGESADPVESDQAPAIPAPLCNPCAPPPAVPSEFPNRKLRKRKQHSRKRKGPATSSVPAEAKLLVSRKAAAEMLTISIRKVDYMIADGRMLTRRIDNRVLIPVEEIHKFARSDHPRRKAG